MSGIPTSWWFYQIFLSMWSHVTLKTVFYDLEIMTLKVVRCFEYATLSYQTSYCIGGSSGLFLAFLSEYYRQIKVLTYSKCIAFIFSHLECENIKIVGVLSELSMY